jgi:hypothetical protein
MRRSIANTPRMAKSPPLRRRRWSDIVVAVVDSIRVSKKRMGALLRALAGVLTQPWEHC